MPNVFPWFGKTNAFTVTRCANEGAECVFVQLFGNTLFESMARIVVPRKIPTNGKNSRARSRET